MLVMKQPSLCCQSEEYLEQKRRRLLINGYFVELYPGRYFSVGIGRYFSVFTIPIPKENSVGTFSVVDMKKQELHDSEISFKWNINISFRQHYDPLQDPPQKKKTQHETNASAGGSVASARMRLRANSDMHASW